MFGQRHTQTQDEPGPGSGIVSGRMVLNTPQHVALLQAVPATLGEMG